MGINIVETKPGHISLSCQDSGRPLTRSNDYGMFCDAEVCACEVRSMEMSQRLGIGPRGEGVVEAMERLLGPLGVK